MSKIPQGAAVNEFSFEKGFNKVSIKHCKTLRSDLKFALKINSTPAWLNRLRGKIEPKVSEARAIEAIFLVHGIEDIWGD